MGCPHDYLFNGQCCYCDNGMDELQIEKILNSHQTLLRVVRAAEEMVSDYHNGETNRYPIMDELRETLEALPEHLRQLTKDR